MEIGLVVAEIFGEICRFLPSHPIWVTRLILIKFARDVATVLPLNIFESKLAYSYPFWNASLSNKGHFANFGQNLVDKATSIGESEREVQIDKVHANAFYLVKKL